MRRREFLSFLAGATAFWPLTARAQKQTTLPVIGFLDSRSATEAAGVIAAFHGGLNEVGYVDGRNVGFDYRFANGRYDRLPSLAADLANSRAAVILAGGPPAVLAAKAAITTIPTVFLSSLDPIKLGLAASLNRPGRNMTGVYLFTSALEPKKLDILQQLVPKAAVIGVLLNPNNPNADTVSNDLQTAARTLGTTLLILNASSPDDIDACYATIVQRAVGALLVVTDPFLTGRHNQLVGLAARHSVPTIYALRESVEHGGLVSYGSSITDAYRQAGLYSGKILKGANPADLPVMQPTKFELVINLQTAKTLGLAVPLRLQIAADDLID